VVIDRQVKVLEPIAGQGILREVLSVSVISMVTPQRFRALRSASMSCTTPGQGVPASLPGTSQENPFGPRLAGTAFSAASNGCISISTAAFTVRGW
jgi:hypothetical protein